MKYSVSWPPISAVSGCCVRYRDRGAGKRMENCFGLQRCMIGIIKAKRTSFSPIFCGALYCVHPWQSDFIDCAGCVCVCEAPGLWWVFVIGVAGYITSGGRGAVEELSGRPWLDSSLKVEGRSNAHEWQLCRDKASCQSPASVAHHRLPATPRPNTVYPRGALRQDKGDLKCCVTPQH